jgi:hypothetical protein
MLDAYSARDRGEAKEAAEDLLGWLRRGGFPPQTLPELPMDNPWNRAIADAACKFVFLRCGSHTT